MDSKGVWVRLKDPEAFQRKFGCESVEVAKHHIYNIYLNYIWYSYCERKCNMHSMHKLNCESAPLLLLLLLLLLFAICSIFCLKMNFCRPVVRTHLKAKIKGIAYNQYWKRNHVHQTFISPMLISSIPKLLRCAFNTQLENLPKTQ